MVKFTCSRCKFVLRGQVPLMQISAKTSIYTGETVLVVRWCPNGCELTAAPGHDEGAPACPESGQVGAVRKRRTRRPTSRKDLKYIMCETKVSVTAGVRTIAALAFASLNPAVPSWPLIVTVTLALSTSVRVVVRSETHRSAA